MGINFRDDNRQDFNWRKNSRTDIRAWKIRLQLFWLIGLLLVVLFLMWQARNPENYRWLIPEKEKPNAPKGMTDITDSVFGDEVTKPPQSAPEPADPGSKKQDLDIEQPDNQPLSISTDTPNVVSVASPGEEVDGSNINELLEALEYSEQKTLFRLLNVSAANQSSGAAATGIAVLTKIDDSLDNLIARQIEENQRASVNSLAEHNRSQYVFQLKQQWDEIIRPALTARADGVSLSQIQADAVDRFAEKLREACLSRVQDSTEVARPSDGLAWLLCWRQILTEPTHSAISSSPYDLLTQPKRFRGKSILFSGTLRGFERVGSANSELGIDNYFALWIQPKEMDSTPYCVYALTLPLGLDPISSGFERARMPVEVQGIFFKIRTYVDTKDQLSTCPLVLAQSVRKIQPAATASEITTWKPPLWLLIVIVSAIPIIAGAIAFAVLRSTKGVTVPTSANRQTQLKNQLDDLKADGSIRSDRQRIAQMESNHAD